MPTQEYEVIFFHNVIVLVKGNTGLVLEHSYTHPSSNGLPKWNGACECCYGNHNSWCYWEDLEHLMQERNIEIIFDQCKSYSTEELATYTDCNFFKFLTQVGFNAKQIKRHIIQYRYQILGIDHPILSEH